MATKTFSGLPVGSATNLTGAAVFGVDDSTGATVHYTMATLRTKVFAGGTGYTATDPLVVGAITSAGDSRFGNIGLASGNQVNESGSDNDGGLYLNYAGYQNAFTRFRDLLIGNGKGAIIAQFSGVSGRCTLANDLVLGAPSGTAVNNSIWIESGLLKFRAGGVTKTVTAT